MTTQNGLDICIILCWSKRKYDLFAFGNIQKSIHKICSILLPYTANRGIDKQKRIMLRNILKGKRK